MKIKIQLFRDNSRRAFASSANNDQISEAEYFILSNLLEENIKRPGKHFRAIIDITFEDETKQKPEA